MNKDEGGPQGGGMSHSYLSSARLSGLFRVFRVFGRSCPPLAYSVVCGVTAFAGHDPLDFELWIMTEVDEQT